jgi:signal transduction histidine kinase
MRRRIVICLLTLYVLCFVGPVVAMICLNVSVSRMTALADSHRIQSLRAELAAHGTRIERDLLRAVHQQTMDRSAQAGTLNRFDETLTGCRACHHDPAVNERLEQLRDAFERYREKANLLLVVGDAGAYARSTEVQELAAAVVTRATDMADEAAMHLAVRGRDVARGIRRVRIGLIATFVVSIAVAGYVALHLKRRLTKPLKALLDGVQRVREGDVAHRFEVEGDEECRVLGEAFNDACEKLRHAQASLIQAEKMAFVGKLSAGIAHEVGNPLASISSVAQMMRRDCHDDQEAARIELIMQHIERVSRVVREMLTFARPAAGPSRSRVLIGPLLDQTVALLRYDKRSGNVRITCAVDGDPSLSRGDDAQLLLVFTNIVINAIDALGDRQDGDAMIRIRAGQQDQHIIVQFEDNGRGMTDTQIAEAFDLFYTTKKPGAGTGLGLWVCQEILRRHQGTIRIDSQVGQGTTVTLDLPKEPAAGTADSTLVEC